jgi:hypothetical protein
MFAEQEIELYDNHTEPETLPRLDIQRGVFITSDNQEIELSNRRVTSLMLERVLNAGKPTVPHIEITLLGKHKEVQENRNDPSYLQALKDWESEQQLRMMRYVFDVGVNGAPPDWFVDEQLDYFPNASRVDLKYLWVASRIPDSDLQAFSEAIVGRTIATAKGLEEAAESFRSEDQRTESE